MMAINNDAIIHHFGGLQKMTIRLANVFDLMRRQPNCGQHGEVVGSLLTDGRKNIFYVPDVNGDIRAITLSACLLGWCLDADPDPIDISNLAHFDGRIFHC
jgi:hypothetical protein